MILEVRPVAYLVPVVRFAASEAPVGIEPTVGDLQSPALPLGDGALPPSLLGSGRAIYLRLPAYGTGSVFSLKTGDRRLRA